MAGILSINVSNNVDKRRLEKKLSFNVGEKFSGRIVKSDESKSTLTLRLPDGWQFEAEIDEPIDFLHEKKLLKFEVDGYRNGKLQIKLVKGKNKEGGLEDSSLQRVFDEQNLEINSKNIELLRKMIKHSIPLTKENISQMKNIFNFQMRLLTNSEEGSKFIELYLESKNIPSDSEKGRVITKILENFFEEFKKLDLDTLLALKENDVDLTGDNIKSFNKLVNGSLTLYKNIKELNIFSTEGELDTFINSKNSIDISKIINRSFDSKEIIKNEPDKKANIYQDINEKGIEQNINPKDIINNVKISNQYLKHTSKINSELKQMLSELGIYDDDSQTELVEQLRDVFINNSEKINKNEKSINLNLRENINSLINENNEDIISTLDIKKDNLQDKTQVNTNKENIENVKNNNISDENIINNNTREKSIDKNTVDNIKDNIEIKKFDDIKMKTNLLVKQEIDSKINEMKNIIKTFMEKRMNLNSEVYDKIIQGFSEKINDFKVFNSISSQYYYLDVPVNIKDNKYPCKLIIKDDRKNGKKIDSKNIKIVTSIKTINIGTVDVYVKVSNINMNIDIKCEKSWVNIIDLAKDKLLKDLSDSNYRITVSVKEKEENMNLITCRDFFEDKNLGRLNIKV
jgi:hypothetical protein